MKSNRKFILVRCFLLFALVFFSLVSNSQSLTVATSNWVKSPFDHKVFIENMGQYNWSDNGSGKNTLYGASIGDIEIHFSNAGLTYTKTELRKVNESGRKEGKDKREKKYLKIPHHAYLEWVGANKDVRIVSQDIENHYFTYGGLNSDSNVISLKASAFKKIVYENLYPHIDVEYLFPEDKPGIKYTVILHPGADASVVKMKYSGQGKASLTSEGNIEIELGGEKILDHAPVSFYEDRSPVASTFKLDNDIVSFALADYDKSKTLIIDPWTIVPTFAGYNAAYDVDYDFQGNVYVYGGQVPYQEIKFNSAGVIQWVYTTTIFSGSFSNYYGDFAVDAATGRSYIVEGINTGAGARVIKLNAAGGQLIVFAGNPQLEEMWRIFYNNCTKKAVIAGGGVTYTNQACVFDTNLVNMTAVNVVSTTEIAHDMCLLALDNSNNCYMSTTNYGDPTLNNVIIKCPANTLLPLAFQVFSGYTFQEGGSYTYINNGVGTANGFNGMAVSNKYLYTYDGRTIKRWNKNTGALINSSVLSTTSFYWGGLAVDDCDNIFAGVQSSIVQYDTNFTVIATIPAANTVYDVRLGVGNTLYACGKQFVSSFNITTLPPCTSYSASVAAAGSCTAGSATVTVTGGLAPYTYSWNPIGQTTQVATGLTTGTYTVLVIDNSCIPKAQSLTFSVTAGGLASTSASTPTACLLSNGTATVTPTGGTGAYTYSWSPSGGTDAVATGLSAGTYTITVADNTGCTGTSTATVTSTGGTTVSLSNQTDVLCSGGSDGSADVLASGGASPYTYSWSPSGGTSSGATGLSIGSYTVLITDASGCTQSQTVSITQPTAITSTATSTQASCGNSNGTATVTPSGGTGSYTYSWLPSGGNSSTATGLGVGTYSALITDANACSHTQTVAVTQQSTLLATANATPTACLGSTGSATVSASGGTSPLTYSWSPSGGTNATATGLSAGNYTATVTDAGGCTQTAVATVTILGGPAANAGLNASILQGSNTTLTGAGGGTYNWDPSTSLSCTTCPDPVASPSVTTTYTLVVTDANGCTDTAAVTVYVSEIPCSNIPNAGRFFLPNAFSPNADGDNDDLCLQGWDECLVEFSIQIYNRWGERVFESEEKTFCWDGSYNGKQLNNATFAYVVRAVLYNGEKRETKGNISLMR